jgi:drug/metabolite transporter (DMT)-like permease
MKHEKQLWVVAAFAAIYLIWGSTYLAILLGLKTIPPFMLAGLRFAVTGLILFGWSYLRGERPRWDHWRQNALAGVLMLFGGNVAVVWSELHVSSGLSAIIVASMPFWFVLLDRRQWAYNFSNKTILLGIAVGFAGIFMLFRPDQVQDEALMPLPVLAVLLAGCICWAGGSLYVKYHPTRLSTGMSAGIQSLAGGAVSLLVSGLSGEARSFAPAAVTTESWLALAYLIVMGSLVAYMAYVWLLSIRPAVQVGTYAYVNPVVALLLGWIFASEPLGPTELGALTIILAGVLLVNLPKYRSLKAKPA